VEKEKSEFKPGGQGPIPETQTQRKGTPVANHRFTQVNHPF
jgi:hypothetical protein